MERPSKRPRLSENVDQEEFDLGEARARNNLKLKSRFEGIFEKYGKDFSSMGDEIDLKTGAIIVNNGHLEDMQNEQDIGREADDPDADGTHSLEEPEFNWIDDNEEFGDTEPPLPPNGFNGQDGISPHSQRGYDFETQQEQFSHRSNAQDSESEGDDPLSSHLSVNPTPDIAGNQKDGLPHYDHGIPNGSKPSQRYNGQADPETKETPSNNKRIPRISPIETLWQTPEIEGLLPGRVSKSAPMYTPPDREMSLSPSNGKSLWAGPWTRLPRKDKGIKKGPKQLRSTQLKRKLFSTPELQALRNYNFSDLGAESDDSDDPLQSDSYQTPIKRPSADVVKRANGSNTPSGTNNNGKKFCKFCEIYFSELQFGHHFDTILSNDEYDGVHDLEEIKKIRETLSRTGQPENSEERKNDENELIASEVTVTTPVPVSKAPTPKRLSSRKQIVSPPKASPLSQKQSGHHTVQEPPDKDDSNDIDPFADDFDAVSATSGLSSIQIEPSPAKTPRGKQGSSSPFVMRSSVKRRENEERFGWFSKRPVKVPIFRRTNF